VISMTSLFNNMSSSREGGGEALVVSSVFSILSLSSVSKLAKKSSSSSFLGEVVTAGGGSGDSIPLGCDGVSSCPSIVVSRDSFRSDTRFVKKSSSLTSVLSGVVGGGDE